MVGSYFCIYLYQHQHRHHHHHEPCTVLVSLWKTHECVCMCACVCVCVLVCVWVTIIKCHGRHQCGYSKHTNVCVRGGAGVKVAVDLSSGPVRVLIVFPWRYGFSRRLRWWGRLTFFALCFQSGQSRSGEKNHRISASWIHSPSSLLRSASVVVGESVRGAGHVRHPQFVFGLI